ncbi:MFS general substrate transporter [Aspergillus homomorphus CBS 101889]|uniref:MFS general substrate transporter n=1 Tax=Aspergillus homomorphus (strain CBS 101889) TaxID=1450537 RepID=A0A395HWD9_ASPHC|nr:MFS general substrate transporter [Aspergillus homomorphus CBS 101889]RAL11836.1 MFS general substrate transporter [Aspergillus homomorphus CBS 101889]
MPDNSVERAAVNINLSHIEDPNQRRRLALSQIDNAPFGWRHVRAVIVAGVGFFTDSYDIFAINLCSSMLGVVYWQQAAERPGKIPYGSDTAIKVSTSAGTVIGQFAAAIVALILTVAFKLSLETAATVGKCGDVCQLAVDKMWRIVISFGAVPACIALYYRLTIPETPRYTFDIAKDLVKGDEDVRAYIAGKHEGRPDEARGSSLTLRSMVSGINNSIILTAIGWNGGSNIYEYFYRNAVGNLILICAGAIPGYWMTVATVDSIGRKPIQLVGFVILTTVFIIIGFAYASLKQSQNALLALYVVAQFFFNFGPNATTFIVPGECFPTRYRSTSHGMSAAAGKVGAIIAQCVFGPLAHRGAQGGISSSDTPWLNHVMQIFALFMVCGFLTTWLIPETKGRTLEYLAGEDESS